MLWRVEGKGTNACRNRASIFLLSLCHDGGGDNLAAEGDLDAVDEGLRSLGGRGNVLPRCFELLDLGSQWLHLPSVASLLPAPASIVIVFRGATPVDWISFRLWHVIDSKIFSHGLGIIAPKGSNIVS